MDERMLRFSKKVSELSDMLEQLAEAANKVADFIANHEERILRLEDAIARSITKPDSA